MPNVWYILKAASSEERYNCGLGLPERYAENNEELAVGRGTENSRQRER